MINKQIEIKLGGNKIPLWFNNFSAFELQKMYGVGQSKVMSRIKERLEENFLLVLSDLVEVGIKGEYMANKKVSPDYLSSINAQIAQEDEGNLLSIWVECFSVFTEHMGLNVPQQETTGKKKVTPKQKKATP